MIDVCDLLGRQEIDLGVDGSAVASRRVLVTGAGGSIGSVLCRRLAQFGPADLIMLDRDESGLHATQLALTGQALLNDRTTVLADIRDKMRMVRVFDEYRPDIVFHAAALKHQPLLERYPEEAMRTNIMGTRNVLLAAASVTPVLVNISTDKAANPSCILGASKRLAERLVAWYGQKYQMTALSVRFGNVINSRGSVMDTFRWQIEHNQALTVTSPWAIRYFMTGDEAASLLIHAAAIGENGQALVMDMGQPIKIDDIARKLIKDAGHGVVRYTGLRIGEKDLETLIGEHEVDARPNHPLISQVTVPPISPQFIDGLIRPLETGSTLIGASLMALTEGD